MTDAGYVFVGWEDDYNTTHTSKTLAYEGALTPVRATGNEEGLGFFLYPGQSSYETPAGATVKYAFNGSYDFLLLGQ